MNLLTVIFASTTLFTHPLSLHHDPQPIHHVPLSSPRCHRECHRWHVRLRRERKETPPILERVSLEATSYCEGSVTASGIAPYTGEVANNTWELGTEIEVSPPVYGLTRFKVEDRIGYGSQIDFYTPSCSEAIAFGRQTVGVSVIG